MRCGRDLLFPRFTREIRGFLAFLLFRLENRVAFLPWLHQRLDLCRGEKWDHVLRLSFRLATREREFGAGKETHQPVVVVGGNRIVFMVVASSATSGDPHKVFSKIVDDVFVGQMDIFIDIVAESSCNGEIACCDDPFAALRVRSVREEDIPSDLHLDELVVRHVSIERIKDPVPIPPRVHEWAIGIFSGGVGIPDHVEPMATPLHSILRGCEETFEDTVG